MDTAMTWINKPRPPKRNIAILEPVIEEPMPVAPKATLPVRVGSGHEVELPRRAALKLRRWQDESEAAHAAYRIVSEKVVDQAQPELLRAEAWHAQVVASLKFGAKPEENPNLADAIEKVGEAKQELAHQIELRELRAAAFTALRAPLSTVERYLRKNSYERFEAVEPPRVTIANGESFADAVEKAREELKALQTSLDSVRRAPFPSVTVKAKARATVESLARQGMPDCLGMIERDESIRWPSASIRGSETFSRSDNGAVSIGDPARGTAQNAVALMAWLFPQQMTEKLEAQIDQLADDAHALTPEERRQKETEIVAEIMATQYREESFIEAAESAGVTIARRETADPRAVLFITGPAPRAR